MIRAVPIYMDHDARYRADSCQPLVQAAAAGQVRFESLRHGHYPGRRLQASALSGVKMLGFWDAPEDQTWGLDWHRNEGVEITFLESGSLAYAVDHREFRLESGDLTIARPWQLHRVGGPHVQASRLHWLIIDVGVRRPHQSWHWPSWLLLVRPDLRELTNILRNNDGAVWRATPQIRRCFLDLRHSMREGGNISHLTLRINDLFLCLLDMFRSRRVRLDETLSSARHTVELFLRDLRSHPEHLALKWTLAEMARSCGLGITQFAHHVRSLANMSSLQFLAHCRLDLAAEMLRVQPEMPVTEIALGCGYSSSQYFATAFARRFGSSPTAYRAAGRPGAHAIRPPMVGRASSPAGSSHAPVGP